MPNPISTRSTVTRTTPIITGVVLLLTSIFLVNASGQSMFELGEVITFADCSNGWSIDAGIDEIFIATDGGIWRHDRRSGKPLDPWISGLGWDKAVSLTHGRVVLYHSFSNTVWLVRQIDNHYELTYYRPERTRWYRIEMTFPDLPALGEGRYSVVVSSGGRFWQINPLNGLISQGSEPEIIRWQEAARTGGGINGYTAHDQDIYYDDQTGTITYKKLTRYFPSAHYFDQQERRRYVCYPRFGVIVGNDRSLSFDWYRTGPESSDIRAVAIDDKGGIWVGGDGRAFSYFNRKQSRWQSYNRDWQWEIYSTNAHDALIYKRQIYFATDEGIVYRRTKQKFWSLIDNFDGLRDSRVWVFERLRNNLVVGGKEGINIVRLPKGPVWDSGNETLDELHPGDMTKDGDTVWVGGVEGLYRGNPETGWNYISVRGLLGGEAIRSLSVDKRSLWIGSVSGVTRLHRRNGDWTEFYGSTFMRGGMPLTLESSDDDLWVGTEKGLFRYNLDTGGWREYTTDQGLPSNRIQRLRLEADTLWIGTPAGLTRFIWNKPVRDGL